MFGSWGLGFSGPNDGGQGFGPNQQTLEGSFGPFGGVVPSGDRPLQGPAQQARGGRGGGRGVGRGGGGVTGTRPPGPHQFQASGRRSHFRGGREWRQGLVLKFLGARFRLDDVRHASFFEHPAAAADDIRHVLQCPQRLGKLWHGVAIRDGEKCALQFYQNPGGASGCSSVFGRELCSSSSCKTASVYGR